MTNILNLRSILLVLCASLSLFSCHFHHDHHHDHIDDRYFFLGSYHATESFINPQTGVHESYDYDIEVTPVAGNDVEISVTGYGNGGIYGTACAMIGSVYGGTQVEIPLNICHYGANTTFEITGYGELSSDGSHLTFDLDIIRCDGPNCHREPSVHIHAHRL